MQRAVKMVEPEFGFLFQNDAKFEAGLIEWAKYRPEMAQAVAPYLRKKRSAWQNELADFRNYLEHKDETNPRVYAGRYQPAHAERLFDDVWRTIADILALLFSFHLPSGTALVEIPSDDRDPVRPHRFRFVIKGFPSVPLNRVRT
jgi:hypothetical protein